MARPGHRVPGQMWRRALSTGTLLVTALLAGCVLSVATSGAVPVAAAIAVILAVGCAIGHADRRLRAILREELEPAEPYRSPVAPDSTAAAGPAKSSGKDLSGVDEMEFPLSANGTDRR